MYSASKSTALRQLAGMLWKGILVKSIHWISTIFEIAVPMLFMFLLVWIKSLTTVYDSPAVAYTCGQTPPWLFTDHLNIFDPLSTEVLTCVEKPKQCSEHNYYRSGFNLSRFDSTLGLGSIYTQYGYVSAGKSYPFYGLTVGDESYAYEEINEILDSLLPEDVPLEISNPSLPMSQIGERFSLHNRLLAVCPKNPGDEKLDESVLLLETHLEKALGQKTVVRHFGSERLLEHYMTDSHYDEAGYLYGKVAFAVVVEHADLTSHKWEYTLRANTSLLNIGQHTVDCLYAGCQYTYNAPTTLIKTLPLQQPVKADALYGYSYSGFLTLQKSIDEFIISTASKSTNVTKADEDFSMTASFGLFPTQAYVTDEFKFVIASTLGIFYMLAYLLPVSRMIRLLVLEKELRIKEGFQMMGLSPTVYNTSHFLLMLAQMLISSALMISVTADSVFKYSNSGLIFVYFAAFGVAIISLCFLIAAFFSRSKTAATLGTVLFFALFFPYFPATALQWGMTAKTWVCLCAPTCFALGADVVAEYEGGLVGVQLWNTGEITNNFSLNRCVGMLLVDAILYAALAWYFGKVFPSEFGVQEPWHFLFKKSWWRRFLGWTARQRSEKKEFLRPLLLEVEESGSESWGDTIELVGPELMQQVSERQCVEIRNLQKTYGRKKKAVKGIDLNLFEGQITVLLGHNGAGKSTTINMLTGMIPMTGGEVLVRGHRLSRALGTIRTLLGVCPQHDILVPELSPTQHLNLIAIIKGVQSTKVKDEVNRMLRRVGLLEKAHNQSQTLSGGQKRKLSVAMALIGDSKVVILDEPTSGMDPYSRRSTWDLLQRCRKDRVILLTTHFMDEADILGDRIAIMADGELKCCGSSLFLKGRYGVGYTLTINRDLNSRDSERDESKASGPEKQAPSARQLIALTRQYLPSAEILSFVGAELSFRVPFSASSQFEALFGQFEEEKAKLGIQSFGVSVTTLEEVFMKVADGDVDASSVKRSSTLKSATPPGSPSLLAQIKHLKEANSSDRGFGKLLRQRFSVEESTRTAFSINSETPIQELTPRKPKLSNGTPCELLSFNDLIVPAPTKRSLFGTHFVTLIHKRYRIAKRDKKNMCFQLVIPTMLVLLGLSLLQITSQLSQPKLLLSPDMFNPDLPSETKNFVPFQSDSDLGAKIMKQFDSTEKGVHGTAVNITLDDTYLEDQFSGCAVGAETLVQMSNYLLATQNSKMRPEEKGASRYGAITITDSNADSDSKLAYNILVNASALHAPPIYMNLVNEATLKVVSNGTGSIKVSSHPLPRTYSQQKAVQSIDAFSAAIQIMVAFCFIPAAYAIFVVKEKEVKAKHQQIISGISVNVYWLSTFAWDVASYVVPSGITIILIFAFEVGSYTQKWGAPMMILLVLAYGPATASMTYCLSFLFKSHSTAQNMMLFFNFLTGLALMITSFVLNLLESTREVNMKLKYFYRLFPGFCLGDGLLQLALCDKGETCPKLTSSGYSLTETLSPYSWDICGSNLAYLVAEAVVYLLICITMDTFQTVPQLNMLFQRIGDPEDSLQEREDDDVTAEANRIKSGNAWNDAVQLRDLRKVYHTSQGPKVAVKKLSFGVPKGECFGFLGINGAGKTTTLSILCGEFLPTSGSAYISGKDVIQDPKSARQRIGFCPQFDALLELLTVSEHLELYAKIKGVIPNNIQSVVEDKLSQMDLWPFAHRPAGTLSGGNKRKLSVAIALIGDPATVFLDEPSTGMDPVARRFMWDRISKILQEDQECSVILTTHSMEEAEALCGRIGIMVNGALQCLGTSQHLKSKFGKGFEMDIKLKPPDTQVTSSLARRVASQNHEREFLVPPFSDVCSLLHRPDRAEKIIEKGSGSVIWDVARAEGKVPLHLFCEWWVSEDNAEQLAGFLSENFQEVEMLERSTMSSFRYRIIDEGAISLSAIFGLFEYNKKRVNILEYAIGQTTLEQIFNFFASKQNNPEQRLLSRSIDSTA